MPKGKPNQTPKGRGPRSDPANAPDPAESPGVSGSGAEEKIAAFIDIGTNSVRCLIVRLHANSSYTILRREKEVVRLGEGEFESSKLRPEAMERAVLVCEKFAELARTLGASETVAVATAATREARNRAPFVRMLKKKAGLKVRVVSGKEEARLIYLGVVQGLNLGAGRALFVDIGGGSTEVIVGDRSNYTYLDSMRLGAIRVSQRYFKPTDTGPVSDRTYARIQKHVKNTAIRVIQRLREYPVDLVVGSSGTLENLLEVAALRTLNRSCQANEIIPADKIKDTIRYLRSLPVRERRKVPGLNPARADIIVGGAAVIEALIDELNLPGLQSSDRGLQDGMLFDYFSRQEHFQPLAELSARERSVLRLGRLLQFDEPHARNVARLSLDLFDSSRLAGMHDLSDWHRELLEYAALLHDIGVFLSYSGHQQHSYYFIKNADLLGFNQDEIGLIATTALFHRKPSPRKNHVAFAALDAKRQRIVSILSMLLRLAENLDRTHAGMIEHAALRPLDKRTALLEIECRQDCPLERWGVDSQMKAFKRVFGCSLQVESHVLAERK